MQSSRLAAILLAAVALTVFLTPFRRELYVGDETKYSQVIREVRAGNFFLPTLHGTPFTHKPPLHFWAIDALTYLFGVYSTWSFVLPSLVAYLFLLYLMWKIDGPMPAFIAATSVMIWGSAQTARMDLSFTALLVLGAWLLFRFFEHDDFRSLLGAGFALGVATLVKGPMAPVIGIVLFAVEWYRRRRVPRGNYLPAIAALVVTPLLWFVPAMVVGGDAYANEVIVKQTAGRAVGAWVHRSPPWFYVVRSPATLFPWFFLFVAAIVALYKRRDATSWQRFCLSWALAVVVPYSIISSKLDIYMMALIPPVAFLTGNFAASGIADRWTAWGRRANLLAIAICGGIGLAALTIGPRFVKPEDRAIAEMPVLRGFLMALVAASAIAFVVAAVGRRLQISTLAAGLVPIAAFVYLGLFAIPVANEMASTRPLIRALARQNVPAESIALYTSPHLWSRDMPRDLERVRYVGEDDLRRIDPIVIATSRRYAPRISDVLSRYRKVDEVDMIGKKFDVYRR